MEQNARNNFSRNTPLVQAKMFGKKSSEKSAKNVFLYSHEYRDQKMGGTKRAKQYFQKHNISARKKTFGKYRRKKVRKTFFYIHTNIVTKKWGTKRAKQFFQKHTNSARKMFGKKFRENNAKNVFLYSHEYRDQKMGNKTRETIFPETH